jgi:hypothetical protein
MRVGTPWVLVPLLLALAAAGLVLGLSNCGPSPLAKALPPYTAAVSPRLDAEASFWEQLAERTKDQEDAAGIERYRQFLLEKAKPTYARLEADLAAVVPGHERLETAHEQLLGFVRGRKEFVDLELRRLDLSAKAPVLETLKRAQDAEMEAYREYGDAVGDDAPDHRYSTVNALKKGFHEGKFDRALQGSGDVADAVETLKKSVLPQLRELRDGRFEDTPQGKLFRRCIVTTEEFYALLADHLPALVDTMRAASRSDTVLRQADAQRTNFQTQIGAAQRER